MGTCSSSHFRASVAFAGSRSVNSYVSHSWYSLLVAFVLTRSASSFGSYQKLPQLLASFEKDDRPLVLTRDHVEAVRPGDKRLPLHLHGVGHGEGRVLVGPGPPRAARASVEPEVGHPPGDELAPDVAAAIVLPPHDPRARVVDCYPDRPDRLRDGSLGILSARRKRQTLRSENGDGEPEERDERQESKANAACHRQTSRPAAERGQSGSWSDTSAGGKCFGDLVDPSPLVRLGIPEELAQVAPLVMARLMPLSSSSVPGVLSAK